MYKYTHKGYSYMKRIAVIPNINKDIGLECTKRIIEFLKDKADICMHTAYKAARLDVRYTDDIYDGTDVFVVIGGDGTILRAAGMCARKNIPILGINLGRIGFMSEVEVDDIENALDRLLRDDYVVEERMMMEVRISGSTQGTFYALNDVVVSKSVDAKLIYMKLYADDEQMNAYVADGVILATPTGSTGYSLSAGGPVVDPLMNLFVATPICAHMLSARPAIMSADKKITLRLDDLPSNEALVSVDGCQQAHIKSTDEVVITKSCYVTRLIRMGNISFYDTLIKKLS